MQYPQKIVLGSGTRTTSFIRQPALYAVHHWHGDTNPAPVLVLDDTAVFEARSADGDQDPVYESEPSGTPAVPTGRVLVRFADRVAARSREDDILRAGYRIVETLRWAPNAAWVEASTGQIADSLASLDRLRDLDDVENVEPQMLLPAAYRS